MHPKYQNKFDILEKTKKELIEKLRNQKASILSEEKVGNWSALQHLSLIHI